LPPKARFTLLVTRGRVKGVEKSSWESRFEAMLLRIRSRSIWYTAGTPRRKVGFTSARFSPSFLIDSAKEIFPPMCSGSRIPTTCSKTWLIGRKERVCMLSSRPKCCAVATMLETMLPWESMAPLERPVVPEV